MKFLRVGDPLIISPRIHGAAGKWGKVYAPPFEGAVYGFLPEYCDLWLVGGVHSVFSRGVYRFDYDGPVWTRAGYAAGRRWIKHYSPSARSFQRFFTGIPDVYSRMSRSGFEICLLPANDGGKYTNIETGLRLWPWDDFGFRVLPNGVLFAPPFSIGNVDSGEIFDTNDGNL
jgi:hypothetical protein